MSGGRRPEPGDPSVRPTLRVEVTDQQPVVAVDRDRLAAAVRGVLAGEGHSQAEVSLVVVDDPTIHRLNRLYLDHDYPTDVLSFVLSDPGEPLSGEVIVSAQTAEASAAEYGWSPLDELLLYAIHGTLHLCGYDDHADAERVRMRQLEAHYLLPWVGTANRSQDARTFGRGGPP